MAGATGSATGDHVAVSVRREGGDLVVRARSVATPLPVSVADRVGALGGRIGIENGVLLAAIPCA